MIEDEGTSGGTIFANPLRRAAFQAAPPRSPRWFHRRLPGYAVTPLHEVVPLASELGVGRLFVKDESLRLGLPAFKMLGASWAIYLALSERLGREPPGWQTIDDLRAVIAPLRPLTLATATDGNHGRAVARMAGLLGLAARIWVPAHTVAARIAAIRAEGAEVVVSTGGYDDAVAEAAAAADARTLVISDTSWPGYDTVPRWVIEGYVTILEEIDEQLAAAGLRAPGAVIVPIGVGALAATVALHYRGGARGGTALIGVEPIDAACMLESVRAGGIVTLDGPQESIMAGLNCGTPSAVAWPTVSAAYDWFVTVSDAEVVQAMRSLNRHGIVSGESGSAPLAAASAMARAGTFSGLASVVLLSTEGITDPVFYAREVLAQG